MYLKQLNYINKIVQNINDQKKVVEKNVEIFN